MNIFKKIVGGLIVLTWAIFWFHDNWQDMKNNMPYYKFAVKSSLDPLRAIHCVYDRGTRDYYWILKFCNDAISRKENIQLIIPKNPKERYEFLREKGRYYLYPRNYGNNEEMANFILVYGVKDFEIPKGYHKYVVFTHDKYLAIKTGAL